MDNSFLEIYDLLTGINEDLTEAKNKKNSISKNGKAVEGPKFSFNFNSVKSLASIGVAAKNQYWTILGEEEFFKNFVDLKDKNVKQAIIDRLNLQIPRIALNGTWPDSDTIKGHEPKIIEVKLGKGLNNKPLRILGFTLYDTNTDKRYFIFGSCFIKTTESLTAEQRSSCDKSYNIVMNSK